MSEPLLKRLLERLKQSKTIVKTKYGGNVYLENYTKLISLVSDHPVYRAKLDKWKKDLGEIKNDPQGAFDWEHSHKEKMSKLQKEITAFIGEFNFNDVYRNQVELFTYNSLICPSRNEHLDKDHIPSLVVLDTDEDKNLNAHLVAPNSRYVQIFDWTTLKDIEDNWKSIKEDKKDAILDVDSGDLLSSLMWSFKQDGSTNKEITMMVNSEYRSMLKNVSDKMLGEDQVRIYLHRYANRLKKLRDF